MRFTKIIVAFAAAFSLLWNAQADAAQPEVILISPGDGAVLSQPPTSIHMCFASPVNIKDLDKGGDFSFRVATPDGSGLGLRIVFQTDGMGVDVQPGLPSPAPEGEWTFDWRVTDPTTLEPASGTIKFTVRPDGSPPPGEALAPCGGTPRPDATAGAIGDSDEDDGGSGLLLAAIIAAGVAAGAAGVGFILVRLRRRQR